MYIQAVGYNGACTVCSKTLKLVSINIFCFNFLQCKKLRKKLKHDKTIEESILEAKTMEKTDCFFASFSFCVITFEPIEVQTCPAPQNNHLNLSFSKDINVDDRKSLIHELLYLNLNWFKSYDTKHKFSVYGFL